MAILFFYIKRLPKRRKYLKAIFSSYILLEDGQHFLQGLPGKNNNNISTFKPYSTHNKANGQAFHKTEIKISSKRRYKAFQVR